MYTKTKQSLQVVCFYGLFFPPVDGESTPYEMNTFKQLLIFVFPIYTPYLKLLQIKFVVLSGVLLYLTCKLFFMIATEKT
jgi:hypothetical protein